MVDFKLNLNTETVGSAYPSEALTVEPDTPLRDVLALLKAQSSGCVLICRGGRLAGIFTERDALRLMAQRAPLDVPIESVMVARVTTVGGDETVEGAIQKMSEGGYRSLPIVDDQNVPQGVVRASGIVHYLVEHFPERVYNLPPAPNPVMQQREGA